MWHTCNTEGKQNVFLQSKNRQVTNMGNRAKSRKLIQKNYPFSQFPKIQVGFTIHPPRWHFFWGGGRCNFYFLFDSTCFVAQSMSLLDTYFFRHFNILNILITITRRFTYSLAKFTVAPQKMSPWRVCCKNYWNFAEFGKKPKRDSFFSNVNNFSAVLFS
jgi:hypothetical protein